MCLIFALCSIIHKESQFELVVVSINLNLSINTQHHETKNKTQTSTFVSQWFVLIFGLLFLLFCAVSQWNAQIR